MSHLFIYKKLVTFSLFLVLTPGLTAQGILNTGGTYILTKGAVSIIVNDGGLTNNGNLQFNTDASIIVHTDFNNTATAQLRNNGNFYIKRNITNNESAMNACTGTLFVNGTSIQTLTGTQTFKTFNFVSNNTAGVLLNNNLSVAGTHTFISGMITTSATPNYMIYEAGSSHLGCSDTRHVNGWVKKLGSTNFSFPVGNATYSRPIALINLTATAEFDVLHTVAVTPDRYSLYNPLVYVDSGEHWTINKISGAAAQVAMNWDNSKVPFPNLMISDIRAASFDGIFWRSIGGSASGSALTTGNVTSNSISAFNTNFTIGSISYVLPLQIISFTAGRMNDYTKLNWTIGNELNVDRYELQRSDDGINFYTVHTHRPFNRNGTEFYSYDDSKTLKGTAYYRLKINSLGTQVNYSHIVNVSVNDNSKTFYVITNPFDANIDLYADAAVKGIYNYTIAGTGGQVMQSGILDIKNAGIYSIHLKSVFATGAYILVVQNETNRLQKTIFKK